MNRFWMWLAMTIVVGAMAGLIIGISTNASREWAASVAAVVVAFSWLFSKPLLRMTEHHYPAKK